MTRPHDGNHPARTASQASVRAVESGDKAAWLALFADNAVIEDPIGVSALDPEGKGHRGLAAIDTFWEANIAGRGFRFDVERSHAAGNEVANVGTITTEFATAAVPSSRGSSPTASTAPGS